MQRRKFFVAMQTILTKNYSEANLHLSLFCVYRAKDYKNFFFNTFNQDNALLF